ncbi:MAG: hypothetical protein ACOH2J_16170, partial [Allorhizobium sp.]
MGGLNKYTPSVDGNDYIVASWGSGSFYTYMLAEKVWMALGLSMRVLGQDAQRVVFDDPSLPEFGVACQRRGKTRPLWRSKSRPA